MLQEDDLYDLMIVDGDHSIGVGVCEIEEILKRSPKLVIHHDVTATVAGYKLSEGPEYAHSELQANGWQCFIDSKVRGNEKTQRGIMLSTNDSEIGDLIRKCMGLVCY